MGKHWKPEEDKLVLTEISTRASANDGRAAFPRNWSIPGRTPGATSTRAYRLYEYSQGRAYTSDIRDRKNLLSIIRTTQQSAQDVGIVIPRFVKSMANVKPVPGRRKGSPHRRTTPGKNATVPFSKMVCTVRHPTVWAVRAATAKTKGVADVCDAYNKYRALQGHLAVKLQTVQRYLNGSGTVGYENGPPEEFKRFLAVQI